MILSSAGFFVLFGAVFALWYGAPARWRWLVLLAGNLFFYAFGATPGLWWCLAAGILISWATALAMAGSRGIAARRFWLAAGLAGTLCFLIAFKYLRLMPGSAPGSFVQPIGISFYTLQAVSYLIDVYRGGLEPERHLGRYAACISFFATLTSGPITRPARLLPQLRAACAAPRPFDSEQASRGLLCFVFGLYEKCALSYVLGVRVELAYGAPETVIGPTLVIATVLYAFQLYYDFAGYSNMARGLGMVLGLDLPNNFHLPYMAASMREYWGGWHLSLSSWLRDYIYIPLGGSRKGAVRAVVNHAVTFLVSALWHGVNVCFLIWGGLHVLFQAVSRLTVPLRAGAYAALHLDQNGRIARIWRRAFTFVLILFTLVFFGTASRDGTPAQAVELLRRMAAEFSLSPRRWLDGLAMAEINKQTAPMMAGLFCAAAGINFASRRTTPEDWLYARPAWLRTALCWAFVGAALLFGSTVDGGIYFQF